MYGDRKSFTWCWRCGVVRSPASWASSPPPPRAAHAGAHTRAHTPAPSSLSTPASSTSTGTGSPAVVQGTRTQNVSTRVHSAAALRLRVLTFSPSSPEPLFLVLPSSPSAVGVLGLVLVADPFTGPGTCRAAFPPDGLTGGSCWRHLLVASPQCLHRSGWGAGPPETRIGAKPRAAFRASLTKVDVTGQGSLGPDLGKRTGCHAGSPG